MNKDRLEGMWKQAKGLARQRWGMLTDDDLDRIEGARDRLIGKIQERYGLAKERAEQEVDDFIDELDREDRQDRDRKYGT